MYPQNQTQEMMLTAWNFVISGRRSHINSNDNYVALVTVTAVSPTIYISVHSCSYFYILHAHEYKQAMGNDLGVTVIFIVFAGNL